MERRTKIVATIGPASESEEILKALFNAGMNVTRLNFSHGAHEDHAKRIATIRAVGKQIGKPIAILQDLQGPKIRVGKLEANIDLEIEEAVVLFAQGDKPPKSDKKLIPVAFPELFESVVAGNRILMDDGKLVFEVNSINGRTLIATVKEGGRLSSSKGINLPGANITIPGFTEKDSVDLEFGLTQGIDMVAVSFVRNADDIKVVRAAIEKKQQGGYIPLIIAKIERPEALDNLDAIIEVSDGVMVARGDLGVEMSPERVPTAQKRIIRAANQSGKFVITATQMLESMISSPIPTRAEASDVANAIFDGTDAVMLSAETASGYHPVESVTIMDRIAREAENGLMEWGRQGAVQEMPTHDDASSMTRAARELAHDLNVAAIAVFTDSGRTARLMSKARPRVPILAFTSIDRTYQRMSFFWGVIPRLIPNVDTLREMLNYVDADLMKNDWVKEGQQVVVITGFPVKPAHSPNMALLHKVGE